MTTTSPSAALTDALATYLRTKLQATAGFGDSDVVTDWPEPTLDLRLSATRVIVAVIRAGEPKDDERVGQPVLTRVTPGAAPMATLRYDFGQVDLPMTLGVWAFSKAMRDDADEVLHGLLNQPYWTTVSPLVSTTSPAAIAKGAAAVTPASMANIWPEAMLRVGGTGGETVRVDSITPTTFTATFVAAHAGGATIVEVAARRHNAENGLSLRAPQHWNLVARYDFGAPRSLDDAEGGRGSQRQEWRSISSGTGSLRHVREVSGVLQVSGATLAPSTTWP